MDAVIPRAPSFPLPGVPTDSLRPWGGVLRKGWETIKLTNITLSLKMLYLVQSVAKMPQDEDSPWRLI
jgi:hypothetical protein